MMDPALIAGHIIISVAAVAVVVSIVASLSQEEIQ
jgi:hypothetical protein